MSARRKSAATLAREAALRTVPMVGDPEAYRRAFDYFVVGYLKGHRAASRAVSGTAEA